KAVLGKLLFWEEQMSSNNRVACGTCHRPAQGGGDPRRAPNPGLDGVQPSPDDTFGSPGIIRSDAANSYLPSSLFGLQPQVTGRAAPSAINGAWFGEAFWDGRARGQFLDPETGLVSLPAGGALESQATGPVLSGVEMAHDARNWTEVEQKLQTARPMAVATNLPPDMAAAIAGGRSYPDLFNAAFGDPAITAARIAFAIATYERTLVPDQTPFDQFVRGNPAALSPQQVNGMNLFNGPARCNLCHTPGLFSDGGFHNLGLRPIAEDSGRLAVSGLFGDRGRFKTPSLRNAGLRSSFMHTGQFTQLGQVLGFYNGGGGPNLDNKDPLLQPLGLQPNLLGDLGNFIANGLTDARVRDGLFPFDRPTLASERIPPAGFLFGPGSPGTGGRVPQILAEVPANVGNVDFKLGVANAVGGAASTLVVALQRAPIGAQLNGINVDVDIHVTPALVGVLLNGPPGAAGAGYGTFAVALPALPGLVGITVFAQWFVWDTGVPAGGASTQGAEVRFF
ncbi:MAG TPA: cytochrome c peroxidase, partial [Burkholderiaceae bacterium]|nr:cytochrome c peroxidase [Burkholderiaceae bacterium]